MIVLWLALQKLRRQWPPQWPKHHRSPGIEKVEISLLVAILGPASDATEHDRHALSEGEAPYVSPHHLDADIGLDVVFGVDHLLDEFGPLLRSHGVLLGWIHPHHGNDLAVSLGEVGQHGHVAAMWRVVGSSQNYLALLIGFPL